MGVANTVSAAVSPVENSVVFRASLPFFEASGTSGTPASRRVRASASSALSKGAEAAPPRLVSGEPITLMSRPSTATFAFRPLPKTGMPFTTCRHQMWRVPSTETYSRASCSVDTSTLKTSACART